MTKFNHPISFGLSRVKLPLIPITIGGYTLCVIVDTGATLSLIDNSVVDKLGDLVAIGSTSNVILGVNGDKSEVNRTATISFNVDKHSFSNVFICKSLYDTLSYIEEESNIQVHGIIGNDFLLANKWIIDYEKLGINSTLYK